MTQLALGALALLACYLESPASSGAAPVLRADFGISAAIPIIISGLGALYGFFKGKAPDNMSNALDGIRGGIVDLGKQVVAGLVGLGGLIARVWAWLRANIAKIFGVLYDVLSTIVQRIVRVLDKIFGPIIDFLDKVKYWVNRIYRDFIRPILDVIELIRTFTRLLAAVGIDWAKELDAKLAALERKVLEPYLFILGKLNELSNWINRIVTLDGLLQRITLLKSLMRDAAYTNRLFWNSQSGNGAARPILPNPWDFEFISGEQIEREHRALILSGAGTLGPALSEWVDDLSIRLRAS